MHSQQTSLERATVRRATIADIPAVFAVRTSVRENHLDLEQLAQRGVTPASLAGMLADEDWRTWVVEEDEAIRGFAMAHSRTGSVFALFVSPSSEGRGFGRALLAEAEAWLFGSGQEVIWLQTDEDPRTRAHRLYQGAGWTLAGSADHGDVRYEKRRGADR